MNLVRARFADLFGMAAELGPFDFWPILPAGDDPQLFVSRNDRPQPFHLVHEHDAVLVHFAGGGSVEFSEGPVRYHDLVPGDHVYLPAGLPYRVVASEPCIQILIKAEDAGLEGVVWYCDACGSQVARVEFDASSESPHRAYFRICCEFNADHATRTCRQCGTVVAEIDLSPYRWLEVADRIDDPASTATWG